MIDEMIVAGCKSYSIRLINRTTGEITYKKANRGIIMNANTEELINHEMIKQMVFNREKGETITVHELSLVKRRLGEIKTKEGMKVHRPFNEKKVLKESKEEEYYVPYGYISP